MMNDRLLAMLSDAAVLPVHACRAGVSWMSIAMELSMVLTRARKVFLLHYLLDGFQIRLRASSDIFIAGRGPEWQWVHSSG
jgi:hypothetical protein